MLTIPDLLLPNEIVEINAMLDVAEYDDGRTTAKGIAIDVKSNRQVSRRWTKVAAARCNPRNGVASQSTVSRSAFTKCLFTGDLFEVSCW